MATEKKRLCVFLADADYQDNIHHLCKGNKFSRGTSEFKFVGFSRISGRPGFSVLKPGKELVDFLHKTEPEAEFDGDHGSIRLKNPEFVDVMDKDFNMYKSSI